MEITIEKEGRIHVAKLKGDFDLGDETKLAEQLQPLILEPNARVAVEMSQLKQINSLGLSELINAVVRARMNKSRLVLAAPSAFVMGVFEVTRLNNWFEIVPTLEAAKKSLLA
ncbi:MAG: STAS domain-containing protein [Phycisphaerales bacterium]|nr:STAS domain-containing protein [Phycisphaerales bacterium]